MGLFLMERLLKLLLWRKAKLRSKDIQEAIKISSKLVRHKTYKGLMKGILSDVKHFFKF